MLVLDLCKLHIIIFIEAHFIKWFCISKEVRIVFLIMTLIIAFRHTSEVHDVFPKVYCSDVIGLHSACIALHMCLNHPKLVPEHFAYLVFPVTT